MTYVNKLTVSITLLLCSASAAQAAEVDAEVIDFLGSFQFVDDDATSATAAPADSNVASGSQPVLVSSSSPAADAASISPVPSTVVSSTGSAIVDSSQPVLAASSSPAADAASIAPTPTVVVAPTGSGAVSSSQPVSASSSVSAPAGSTASGAESNATQTADGKKGFFSKVPGWNSKYGPGKYGKTWSVGALVTLAAGWFIADKNPTFHAKVTKPVKESLEKFLKNLRKKTSYQIAAVGAVALAVAICYREALSKFVWDKDTTPATETTPVVPPASVAGGAAPVLPAMPPSA